MFGITPDSAVWVHDLEIDPCTRHTQLCKRYHVLPPDELLCLRKRVPDPLSGSGRLCIESNTPRHVGIGAVRSNSIFPDPKLESCPEHPKI